LVVLLESNH